MATTRIISMHVSQGKTIADCLTDRIDYSKNPDKTQGGELISAYECDPKTADAEFLYSKRQYKTLTGREQQSDVIAYQVRQSFKPGEITPEDANRVGYEFAERFLNGRHAFFVATHTDKKHIHNHIIWNSTTLDCKHKFRDFLGSGRAVARLSDAICTEHRLSVIADPKRGVNHYGRWLGNKAKPSHRELLCGLIDAALLQKPDSFDTLLKLLAEAGCKVRRRGNTLSLRHPDRKGFIRLSSIENYTEDALRTVLAGEKEHMYDTARRVALVKQRVRENNRRKRRRGIYGLSAACMLLFAVLMQAAGTVVGPGQPEAWGVFGAMLLRQDAGGYVLVAIVSFAAAAAITALCFRLRNRENQKKGGADKPNRHEQEEKSQ